jgi:tRNA pseudouridine55 synthase
MNAGSKEFELPPGGGVILVDKARGPTSHDVVLALRKLLRTAKVGHTGTLDPMATGLLVLCLGAATKLSGYLSQRDKEYTGTITFGTVTDSLDAMGKVLESKPVPLPLDERTLSTAMGSMVGELEQIPPMTSAVKVSGHRLHRLARKGVEVERKPRTVSVTAFELIGSTDERVDFRVECSSGTYVRSLASDLGTALGFGAHLSALRRTRVGSFRVSEAASLERLSEADAGELTRRVIPPSKAVDFLPMVVLDADGIRVLCNGGSVSGESISKWDDFKPGEVLGVLDQGGVLRAIGASPGQDRTGRPVAVNPVRVLLD